LLHFVINVAIVTAIIRDINRIDDAQKRLYGNSPTVTFSVFLWITIVLDLGTFIASTTGLAFNIIYMKKSMTRYEYEKIREYQRFKKSNGEHVNEEGCCHAPVAAELLKLKTAIYTSDERKGFDFYNT